LETNDFFGGHHSENIEVPKPIRPQTKSMHASEKLATLDAPKREPLLTVVTGSNY